MSIIRCLFVMLILTLPGCATTSLLSRFSGQPKFARATAKNPAVRCLCLWEPAEGIGVDGKPARGVVGQILFFTRNSVSSVEVDGDVRIFEFDDQGSTDEQAEPLHLFDFSAGAWKTYLTSTQFGPAYQLFVPYSRKGRHQAELALRVRLTPPNGSPLYSDIAKVSLPGYDRAKAKEGSDAYEPETPQAKESADDNFTRSDRITPEKIGETFLQVLAERHEAVGSTEFAVAETSANPHSQRLARRGLASLRNESGGGEFHVADEPHVASNRPARRHVRQVPYTVEEINTEKED